MDKLTKDLHYGFTLGDAVRDKRSNREGRIVQTSQVQLAGDVILVLQDASGDEWTAYVRQVEATR